MHQSSKNISIRSEKNNKNQIPLEILLISSKVKRKSRLQIEIVHEQSKTYFFQGPHSLLFHVSKNYFYQDIDI